MVLLSERLEGGEDVADGLVRGDGGIGTAHLCLHPAGMQRQHKDVVRLGRYLRNN